MDEEISSDILNFIKDPDFIKEAQTELGKLDLLVCGQCHEAFHFIEEFQRHKLPGVCKKVASFKCEPQDKPKPQVWGFTLWKVKQLKIIEKGEPHSSWDFYQNWCKLPPSQKELWSTAGQVLFQCHRVSTAKIEKISEKDLSLTMDDSSNSRSDEKKSLRSEQEKEEFIVESIVSKRFNPRRRYWEYEIKWKNYDETTFEPIAHLENCKELVNEFDEKVRIEKEKEKGPPRGRGRPKLQTTSASGTPITTTTTAATTTTTTPTTQQAAKSSVQKKPQTPFTPIITSPGGRPQRTSKQRALNQVKQWCGSISDEENGKRSYGDLDDDSDDDFERKLRLEAESEDTEEENDGMPLKKVAKIVHNFNNGVGKKLPHNVLIPDSQGVVRISQKQLPSLSSGVYIMSKSSGIIKLDAAASRIATSGGQAIVKVNPKAGVVGQTQVKVIKKDDGSKARVLQVKSHAVGASPQRGTPLTKPFTKQVAKVPQTVTGSTLTHAETMRKIEKIISSGPANKTSMLGQQVRTGPMVAKVPKKDKFNDEDDSDDGLEEMEFPVDLPLPEPDSPPGDFVLDPSTGKIIGQDYPDVDKTTVSEAHPVKEHTETLDNIVKLAAADITEEDLKPDPDTLLVAVTSESASVNNKITSLTPKSEVYTVLTSDVKQSQSILNTAMANSNILQKTLQQGVRQKPKILNQSVAKARPPVSSLLRKPLSQPQQSTSVYSGMKPRFNVTSNHNKNVYTKSNNSTANMPRKVGSTTIWRTKGTAQSVGSSPGRMHQQNTNNVKKTSSGSAGKSTMQHAAASSKLINMPSLNEEETHQIVQQQQPQQQLQLPKQEPIVPDTLSDTDLSFALDSDRPVFITGDDGTVYQVAGQNEQGQTILLTQDSNGQQQCLLVTSEIASEDLAAAEAANISSEVVMEVQEPVDAADDQTLVAQFIRTEPLSPGGTHKVVVMLPNGECMITQVSPEEYANLELGK